ncbi:hypothetical protein CS022_13000 [Veronia nyctiphanis]|uniref:Uncharacterized protein n=1 Tax=Veronia nyctiphanis TaxID=1278244 RepID=A0A4Q0YQY7_9GAMM|nr:YjbH domain-containing protein [Veronia nyctiphanis]RXJ72983.1 hypothetical protein CS022_13000 [Veronia nyctiphanis]
MICLKRNSLLSLVASLSLFTVSFEAFSGQFEPSQSDFGGVGLMQMPTGRSAKDGSFSFGLTFNQDYEHYHASIQLFDRLETTLRYTLLPNRRYSSSVSFGGDNKYTDKGIDVKFKLLDESYWLPETSIGFRDLGGTGLFDGEYIAATKRFGSVDITAGIAWGYMGNSANLSGDEHLSDNECGRVSSYGGKGGQLDVERGFTGCVSAFGGLEYKPSGLPIRLKLEYDANDYKGDFAPLEKAPQSNINLGVIYELSDWGNIRANFERGNTWTLGFTLNTNFNDVHQVWFNDPHPIYAPSDSVKSWKQTQEELTRFSGYRNVSLYDDEGDISVAGTPSKYRNIDVGRERLAATLLNRDETPSSITITERVKGMPVTSINVNGDKLKQVVNQEQVGLRFGDAYKEMSSFTKPTDSSLVGKSYERFTYGLSPALSQSIGSAEDFYLFSLGIAGNAAYMLTNTTEISGSVHLNVFNNYDKFNHTIAPGDSTQLKRVRTLVRQYLSNKPLRMNNLQLTQFGKLGDDVFVQAYAGYLESMFAGVGGEVLFRPLNSNWALGVDANYVKQRDPSSQFGLFSSPTIFDERDKRTYKTQLGTLTGHVSVYYRPEWAWFEDIELKVSAGKYLAEDKGVTVDASRQFESGVKVGAFATKTNLSAEEFGEGSFNKGFYISVPLDVLTTYPSTNRTVVSWVPLTRDGGQMLNRSYHLYGMTGSRYKRSEYIY